MFSKSTPTCLTRLTVLPLILCTGLASADVLVVDQAGGLGVDFLSLQVAANAAIDGDTLLVNSGTYSGLGIFGKGISVVANAGAIVNLATEITVRNLPTGKQVDLVGLRVQGSIDNRGLVTSNNQGVIWAQDCILKGGLGLYVDESKPGVLAINTDQLILIRCTATGANGDEWWPAGVGRGAPAVRAQDSTLHIFESSLIGGDGGDAFDSDYAEDGGKGGDALFLEGSSFAYLSGSTLTPKRGGLFGCDTWGCGSSGPDGTGIYSDMGTSEVYYQDCTFILNGGPTAVGPAGFTPVVLPGMARTLNIQSVASSGGAAILTAKGEPFDLCWAQIANELDPVYLPAIGASSLVALPRRLVFMGALDGNGLLNVALPMPSLGSATASYSTHLQGYFKTTGGASFLGSGGQLLLLGSAY